ncbi:MAG: SpoIIIAH-like family protein [Clostridiales bacterium]|nr:SpoIIIAH-like family protein [Clostridiales bacterium]
MIITALAAMIAVAGYLNYSGTRLDESMLSANSSAVEDLEDGSLAEDISAEDVYAQTGETDDYADIESLDEDVAETGESVGETVLANSTVGVGLVSEAKVTREQTRSRNKEMLMELINSTNITDEQKQGAINEMVEMTDVAEKELAAETLLVAQGFDEVVVSIYDACADVVVSSTQVSDAQRAQIEDIVKRKTGIEAANITITPVTASE